MWRCMCCTCRAFFLWWLNVVETELGFGQEPFLNHQHHKYNSNNDNGSISNQNSTQPPTKAAKNIEAIELLFEAGVHLSAFSSKCSSSAKHSFPPFKSDVWHSTTIHSRFELNRLANARTSYKQSTQSSRDRTNKIDQIIEYTEWMKINRHIFTVAFHVELFYFSHFIHIHSSMFVYLCGAAIFSAHKIYMMTATKMQMGVFMRRLMHVVDSNRVYLGA